MRAKRPGLYSTMVKNFDERMENLFEPEEGDGRDEETEVRTWYPVGPASKGMFQQAEYKDNKLNGRCITVWAHKNADHIYLERYKDGELHG